MSEFTHDLSRLAPRDSDHENIDRVKDAIAEARLSGLDPYDPLPEDLPEGWSDDDD